MASTFSNLKFELIGTGEQSGVWGTTTNTNIGTAIEQAIVGMATLDAADFTANVCTLTLTNTNAAQDARALCLKIDAAALSAAGTVNVPAIQKPYIIINASSYAVTVKVTGQTGVTVPSGKRTVVYNDATDVGNQIDYLSALTAATLTVSGVATFSAGTAAAPSITTAGDTNTGLLFPAADTVGVTTGGTERVRVDSTGNVGIGTSSPTSPLTVYNATAASIELQSDAICIYRAIRASSDATSPVFQSRKARGTIAAPTAVASGDASLAITALAYGGTNYRGVAQIQGVVDTYTSDTNISGYLSFLTNAGSTAVTERMRLTAAGNLGIGNTTADEKLVVTGGISTTAQAGTNKTSAGTFDFYATDNSTRILSWGPVGLGGSISFWSGLGGVLATELGRFESTGNFLVGTTAAGGWSGDGRLVGAKLDGSGWGVSAYKSATTSATGGALLCRVDSTTSNMIGFYYSGATLVGTVSTNGTNVAYNTASDYRLKNITGPVTNSGAYIDSLKPVEGTWKANGSTFVGLIAHEVQEVSRTNISTGEKDGEQMQGMDYSSAEIIANLIAEVQSLRKRLAAAGIA
jgi:hypothetical protein